MRVRVVDDTAREPGAIRRTFLKLDRRSCALADEKHGLVGIVPVRGAYSVTARQVVDQVALKVGVDPSSLVYEPAGHVEITYILGPLGLAAYRARIKHSGSENDG